MRKMPTLAVGLVAVLAIFALGLAACGGDDDANDTETANGAADYRVALVTTGALNNRSWANSWADGVREAAEEFNIQVELVGNADAPDQYLTQGSAFASEGYDLIIFAHGAMNEQAVRVAQQFPETQIITVLQPESEEAQSQEPPNLGHVDPKQQHGTFLAGVLAGLMTETDTIGTVYAFPFPALTRQPEAFELGARCVNPEVDALQRQSDSFTDAAAARAAASALIDQGADFILSAVDQAVQGVIQAAAQAQREGENVYAIPSYFDSNELNPDAVITSVLYNLDGVGFDVIERGVNGELGDHFFQAYTFDNLRVGDLAPFYAQEEEVGQENIDRLDEVKEMIEDGDLIIPDETVSDPEVAGGATIGEPGSAEDIDVADLGCTDEFRSDLGV